MKKLINHKVVHLEIILVSVLSIFILARLMTYAILIDKTLPPELFVQLNSFRLHHFVYGNILITLVGFLHFGLEVKGYSKLFSLLYGIGLGLVLDEFLLWMGDVTQLTSNVMWIPGSALAVGVVSLIIILIIFYRLRFQNEN